MKKMGLSRGKKISLLCLGLFFAAMAIATVVAENVYYASLPAVATEPVVQDQMRVACHAKGTIGFEKETAYCYSPAEFASVELLAESGTAVLRGDALYQFPVNEVLQEKYRLELMALRLEEENRGYGDTKEGQLQRKINDLELEELRDGLDKMEALLENEGVVTARQEGTFTASVPNHSSLWSGQEIGAIASDTGRAFIDWELPEEEGKLFHVGDEVSAVITIKEIKGEELEERDVTYRLRIARAQWDGQGYRFRAGIGDDVMLAMEEGAGTTVNCSYTTRESYEYVVPLNAISFQMDGNSGMVYVLGKRERMYGEEYYVTPYPVEVEYRMGNYAALRNFSGDGEVVTYSTLPLQGEMAVKLLGEE